MFSQYPTRIVDAVSSNLYSHLHISLSRALKEARLASLCLESRAPKRQLTWKKNRTMKTCSPAMQTIIKLSITLKLKILLSVLLTVLKFRFSLVRKYFWFLVIVESRLEILKIDSSNAEVCSGDVPCLEGIEARCSFSTYHPEGSATISQEKGAKSQRLEARTAISKSTNFSANVLISLLKQNLYSPVSLAVKTKSPCLSFFPSMMILSPGPPTS